MGMNELMGMKMNKIITIDAEGEILGRVASRAALALRGKSYSDFLRHLMPTTKVKIINAAKLKLDPLKAKATSKVRYSGYPGGLRSLSWEQIIAKKGIAKPLRLAILGMLPHNRLRAKIIANLTITE